MQSFHVQDCEFSSSDSISSDLKYLGIRKDSKCNEARPSLGVEDPIRVIEIAVIRKDYKLYM